MSLQPLPTPTPEDTATAEPHTSALDPCPEAAEPQLYRCWAEVDLAAVRANAAYLRARTHAPLLCIVKANAYGHGAREVTRALRTETHWFAVANVREAEHISYVLGPEDHVVILGPALPEERAHVVRRRFIPLLSSLEEAQDYSRMAMELDPDGLPLPIHVKLDTGMGRMGLVAGEALAALLEMQKLPGVRLAAFATHLPAADDDPPGAERQLAAFGRYLQELESAGLPVLPWHAQNSAGFMHNLQAVGQAPGWVRPGLTLYGVSPTGEGQDGLERPLSWKARVALVRELPTGHGVSYGSTFVTERPTRVATISAGYADGYPRTISNQGADVLIQGQRCPVLGRVTMDLIMVNVTELPTTPQVGDEVVLLGKAGDEEITAEELAKKAGTIAWEIFTNLSPRVQRVYRGPE